MKIKLNIQTMLAGILIALASFVMVNVAQAAGPQVATLPATATATTLTLNGTFTGGTGTTQVRFQWGATPDMTNGFTTYQSFTTANSTFNATLTGLTSGTTYYFRAEGINAGGPAWGSILNKSTVAYTMPQAQTLPIVTTPTGTSVDVQGWYQSDTSATVSIEYANNSSFIGSYTSSTLAQPSGSGAYTITLSGLSPNTTYWYRAKTTNSAGTKIATTAISFTTSNSVVPPPPPPPNNTCIINSFYANPTNVAYGSSTVISWTTTNCNSVSVTGGGISSSITSGSIASSALYGTTIFYITADGTTQQISVTVTPVVVNQNCSVASFTSSSTFVTPGTTASLYWSISNCSYVTISGPGVSGTYYNGTNSVNTSPLYASGTYTLMAYGTNGNNTSATLYITVNTAQNPNPPYPPYPYQSCVITNFYASPSSVLTGSSTTLYWNTNNCSYVTLDDGSFSNYFYQTQLSVNGQRDSGVIYGTKTFRLTAYGINGSSNPSTVTVSAYSSQIQNATACNDGIDNDVDGKIDSSDPGCSSSSDTSEYNATTIIQSGSGSSNSGSGTTANNLLGISSSVTSGSSMSNNLAGLALFGNTIMPTTVIGFLLLILIILLIVLIARKITKKGTHDSYQSHH